jgi:hypothetical protein
MSVFATLANSIGIAAKFIGTATVAFVHFTRRYWIKKENEHEMD